MVTLGITSSHYYSVLWCFGVLNNVNIQSFILLDKKIFGRMAKSLYFCTRFRQTEVVYTVGVVQLVRAPDCGSGGRGFEPHLPPLVEQEKACSRKVASLLLYEYYGTS